MRIRMLKPRNALKAGSVATVADGVAEMWIHSGVAERMVPQHAVDVTFERSPKRSGKTKSRKRVTA